MLVKLLRQMISPLRPFLNNPQYREWLRLSDHLRSFPPETVSDISFSGLKFRFADASAFLNMYENIFLNRCYEFRTSTTQPLIIDCGANIGLAALWFAVKYPSSRIIAFEPDPFLFEILRHNAETNHLNVDLRCEAVWYENADLPFVPSKKQSGHIAATGNQFCKAVRLIDIIGTFESIDLLKLDIEGAEFRVIHDIGHVLHKIKNLFVEFHFNDGNLKDTLDSLQLIQAAGFRCSIQTPVVKIPFEEKTGLQTLDVYATKK